MAPVDPKSPHTMADHLLGALAAHTHGDDADHDHDHDAMDGLLGAGESDQVQLISIGVDVGSSGTQVAFSRLSLERSGGDKDADGGRMTTARRETLYQSPVSLTPYAQGDKIDEAVLCRFLDHAFASAGLDADAIDCGVVILTGAARERGNAEAITRRLAETCGDIVSASAGHHMEARLAAHGSGAVERSRRTGKRFLNIDIGGGTTKLAVCAAGEIVATAALAIGGRLVATDPAGTILRLEPAGRAHARRQGLDWQVGGSASSGDVGRVAVAMADDLVAVITRAELSTAMTQLFVTAPLPGGEAYDGVIVSGGVGEYVYGRETRDFCDLGRPLGRALAARINGGGLPWPLMPAAECIRATVLGASGYSVQLSGRTGCITAPATLLPLRNAQVLHPRLDLAGEIAPREIAGALAAHLDAFDIDADRTDLIWAFRWQGLPEYARLRAFADGLALGLAERLAHGQPLRMILDGDIASSLGALLRDELGLANELMILDGLALSDFDFIDLGRIRLPSGTVPVTIKTLVFRDDPLQKRGGGGRPKR